MEILKGFVFDIQLFGVDLLTNAATTIDGAAVTAPTADTVYYVGQNFDSTKALYITAAKAEAAESAVAAKIQYKAAAYTATNIDRIEIVKAGDAFTVNSTGVTVTYASGTGTSTVISGTCVFSGAGFIMSATANKLSSASAGLVVETGSAAVTMKGSNPTAITLKNAAAFTFDKDYAVSCAVTVNGVDTITLTEAAGAVTALTITPTVGTDAVIAGLDVNGTAKKAFNFSSSADAYRGLIDLVAAKWDGVNLKHSHKSALKFTMDDYEEMEKARKRLGGISRGEVFRRGIKFLHKTLYDGNELERWKKVAAEKTLSFQSEDEYKSIVYSMNDLEYDELMEICEVYEIDKTAMIRLGFEAVKTLPPEMFPKNEPGRHCFTVRLKKKEADKLERLKTRLNVGGNGIFRVGVLLAERLLEDREKEGDRVAAPQPISLQSKICSIKCPLSLNSARQISILKP